MQTTLIQQQQTAATLKGSICRRLHIDEGKYAEMQYNAGVEYLRLYIPNDAWGRDELERNKTYWAWWRNQWAQRDERFLAEVRGNVSLQLKCYKNEYHNPARLSNEIYPCGIVMGVSYKRMIQELFDNVNAAV